MCSSDLRVMAFFPVLIPLFVIVFRRADEMALAMEARGYRGGEGENENVVAEVLSGRADGVEVPSPWGASGPFRRGRPWGAYIWPASPWLDGFYCSIIMKRTKV